MKQEDRNRLRREKIMAAALREFGTKSYAEASINAICAEDGISKGIVYYYHKNKENLYLACVSACFQALLDYLTKQMPPMEGRTTEENLNIYFDARLKFLEEYPDYGGMLLHANEYPPHDLREQIKQLRAELDRFNIATLQAALKNEKLRKPVTYNDFGALYDLYVIHVRATPLMQEAAAKGAVAREALCKEWANVLLHGAVEPDIP